MGIGDFVGWRGQVKRGSNTVDAGILENPRFASAKLNV